MGTYFPLSNNPRHNPTTVYLRDRLPDPQPDPTFPESSIMYPNYPCIDSASSQQEILLNFGAIESQWKDSREEILMVQGPPEGLSLSLSRNEHHPVYYQNHHAAASGFSSVLGHDGDYALPSGSANPLDSKYLRAARELLDTVVSVGRDRSGGSECSKGSGERVSVSEPSAELSVVADKQELQSKLSKLLAMLDEVDRRYRQYYHQMQAVVASFDVIVGPGASRPYTSLALHTISRHFRCLRDAINSQIAAARRCLGEEAVAADRGGIGISRLRYVDKQLRQQRALQQLGIMQQHAWRPQRGLPETSVSVLRAWLFEHFLHPYPKDSEKIMLARQAGLTRSQVSNWFINARVRLWKPMVEEMYKEEADADVDSNSSSKGEDSLHATSSAGPHLVESKSPAAGLVGPDDAPLLQEGQNGIFTDVSAAYHMSGFGGVDPVSLTLGLQQGEGGGFHPLCGGVGYDDAAADMADEVAEFDYMDSGNRQHQLVSSLLPSFS